VINPLPKKDMIKGAWWKLTSAVLLLYGLIAGFSLDVPRLPILNESIRNLYFHVGMWFAMMALFLGSSIYSLRYLRKGAVEDDQKASGAASVGMLFGILGLLTGMLWAKFTWGAFWVNDPKLNGTAISLLVYLAYFVLRQSMDNPTQKARISAVYNLFAFAIMITFIQVLPRLTDSLHPGNGGNPAFSNYDLDSTMRLVFYPIIIGWIGLGYWILDLRQRWKEINTKLDDNE
jgi:heme exporter protein C